MAQSENHTPEDPPSAAAILAAAAKFHESFVPDQHTASPRRHIVVVTCMDARLDLFRLLGLEIGDSHLLRNAGGRVTADVVRSLVLSSHALGTREVVVIHHTGCGLHHASNEDLNRQLRETVGHHAPEIEFLPFDDVEASVIEDVDQLRACTLLPAGMVTWGAVYDTGNGTLTRVA